MRSFFVVALLALAGCRDSTAPAAKPCVPNFANPDSSKIVLDSAGNLILRVAWCGPITVNQRIK